MSKDSGGQKKTYKFTVDEKKLESDHSSLTGAQIKAMAQVDPGTALFLEGTGNTSDRIVGDNDSVDLSEPGREHFYTMPPANFGTR